MPCRAPPSLRSLDVTPRNTSLITRLWDFLCSLKLTIFTLLMLALTSIIGTVIRQNRSLAEYQQNYGENLASLFVQLKFDDMYHAWWFLGLLILFCLNLIACSLKRLPRLWRSVRNPQKVADDTLFSGLSQKIELTNAMSQDAAATKVEAVVRQHFATPERLEDETGVYFFAQKAPWARFGAYITHLSILIIFVGAIIGNIWGFKSAVNIVEGSSVNAVRIPGQKEAYPLGFTLRCDDFDVQFYEGSTRPREFSSILDVIVDGKEVVSDRKIIVNDPLTYNGITFYQSSYGQVGDTTFSLEITEVKSGATFKRSAKQGQHVPLPDGYSFAITNFSPDYDRFGPAAQMHLNTPDGKHGEPFVILQKFPHFNKASQDRFRFALINYDQRHYTGLQVKKDPGVEVVWLGCFLMVIGSLAAFFVSHRRLWVSVRHDGTSSQIRVGGSTHRNQPGFELYFEGLKQELEKSLKS